MKMKVFVPATGLPDLPGLDHQASMLILHKLCIGHDCVEEGRGIAFHRDTLKRIAGNRYAAIIRKLISDGLIEKTGNHSAGRFSTRYALKPGVAQGSWRVALLDHPDMIRRIQRLQRERDHRRQQTMLSVPHSAFWQHCLNDVDVIPPPLPTEATLNLRTARGHSALDSLAIHAPLSIGRTGRFYTGLTSMPKEFRQYVRLNGRNLVSIDVANSQPLILNAVVKTDKAYRSACEDGQLYESLVDASGLDRTNVKQEVFRLLFGSTRSKVGKAFRKLYPVAWRSLQEYAKELDGITLAASMQQTEADIVLRHVGTRLDEAGVPALSIHDSVVVAPEDAEVAQSAMADAFVRRGLSPRLRLEPLN